MTRKTGGPPKGRIDEDDWIPPGAEESLQRSLDLALQREDADDYEEESEFVYGDIVHDTEIDEPIALVVVNIPDTTAEQLRIGDETLAERNPKYPDDDAVIFVVPLEVLEDYMPNWDEREEEIRLEQLLEDEVPLAPFPSLRLVRVKDSHLRD